MEPITQKSKMDPEPNQTVDFTNTEIAFSNKSDKELIKMARLFRLKSKNALVNVGSKLGMLAVKMRLPFAESLIKYTVYEQFCGGENLLDCQDPIDKLYKYKALTILDYGAEGKSTEEELDHVTNEIIKAIELAASNTSVPAVSSKLSALADNALMEKKQNGVKLNGGEERDFEKLKERLNNICSRAAELKVAVFIDAEESWFQVTIDNLVFDLMEKYNKERAIVYNTYQLYRIDKLVQLQEDHQRAKSQGYYLGAKLVRGAYMDKERERANEEGYPSPIHITKEDTDKDFNAGIKYCIDHYEEIASCCASHNIESNQYQAELIAARSLDRKHPHLNFSQLYGMSDFVTFNLAEAGFNVAKYIPYGPIKEVIPYLIRRAEENSSVTGEMGRELAEVAREIERRGI